MYKYMYHIHVQIYLHLHVHAARGNMGRATSSVVSTKSQEPPTTDVLAEHLRLYLRSSSPKSVILKYLNPVGSRPYTVDRFKILYSTTMSW